MNAARISQAQLLRLAQRKTGQSKKALAAAIGVVPDTIDRIFKGESELKLSSAQRLFSLTGLDSRALEGSSDFRELSPEAAADLGELTCFKQADEKLLAMFEAGDYHSDRPLALATHMLDLASTNEERALARVRYFGVIEARGHYTEALEALQDAEMLGDLSDALRNMIRVNMASALLALGRPLEACGVTNAVLEHYAAHPPAADSRRDRTNQAFAHYMSGRAKLVSIEANPTGGGVRSAARQAVEHFEAAESLYGPIIEDFPEAAAQHRSHTLGAALQRACAEVDAGLRDAAEVIEQVMGHLYANIDPEKSPEDCSDLEAAQAAGQDLDTLGHAAVSVARLITRTLPEAEQPRHLVRLIDSAEKIAAFTKNYWLYESVFVLDHTRHAIESGILGYEKDGFALDEEAAAMCLELMCRFPRFRRIGLAMLNATRYI